MKHEAGKFVFTVFAFLVLTAFASVSEAMTIYVPDDYEKIQWAVDNASVGDTIVVRDGVYVENIKVGKKRQRTALFGLQILPIMFLKRRRIGLT